MGKKQSKVDKVAKVLERAQRYREPGYYVPYFIYERILRAASEELPVTDPRVKMLWGGRHLIGGRFVHPFEPDFFYFRDPATGAEDKGPAPDARGKKVVRVITLTPQEWEEVRGLLEKFFVFRPNGGVLEGHPLRRVLLRWKSDNE